MSDTLSSESASADMVSVMVQLRDALKRQPKVGVRAENMAISDNGDTNLLRLLDKGPLSLVDCQLEDMARRIHTTPPNTEFLCDASNLFALELKQERILPCNEGQRQPKTSNDSYLNLSWS